MNLRCFISYLRESSPKASYKQETFLPMFIHLSMVRKCILSYYLITSTSSSTHDVVKVEKEKKRRSRKKRYSQEAESKGICALATFQTITSITFISFPVNSCFLSISQIRVLLYACEKSIERESLWQRKCRSQRRRKSRESGQRGRRRLPRQRTRFGGHPQRKRRKCHQWRLQRGMPGDS
jgi:hypothetical protein